MSTIFIKPKEGLVIYDVNTKEKLPVEGKKVESSIYWLRRIKAGEVEVVDQLPKNEEPAKNKHQKVSKETEERGK